MLTLLGDPIYLPKRTIATIPVLLLLSAWIIYLVVRDLGAPFEFMRSDLFMSTALFLIWPLSALRGSYLHWRYCRLDTTEGMPCLRCGRPTVAGDRTLRRCEKCGVEFQAEFGRQRWALVGVHLQEFPTPIRPQRPLPPGSITALGVLATVSGLVAMFLIPLPILLGGIWAWVPVILGAIAAISAESYWRNKIQRPMPASDTCGKCGYPLQGLPSNRCPECGTEHETLAEQASAPRELSGPLDSFQTGLPYACAGIGSVIGFASLAALFNSIESVRWLTDVSSVGRLEIRDKNYWFEMVQTRISSELGWMPWLLWIGVLTFSLAIVAYIAFLRRAGAARRKTEAASRTVVIAMSPDISEKVECGSTSAPSHSQNVPL